MKAGELPQALALDDGVDVVGAKQKVVLAVNLDLVATELAVVDLVANLDVRDDALALVADLASANRDDLAALRLLLGATGDVQTGRGLLLLGGGLNENAVSKRLQPSATR